MRSLGITSGALAVLMTVAVGIEAPSTTSAQENPAPRTGRLLERGPYGSGVATIPFVDVSRTTMPTEVTLPSGDKVTCPGAATRTLTTEVWYPAKDDEEIDVRNARPGNSKDGFPLIVYGHGLGSQRLDISHVASHLASYGYVVASVEFPLSKGSAPCGPTANDVANQPGDLIYVSQAIVSAPVKAGYAFASKVDATRTGLMGYSLGGVSAALAANYPTIRAVATLAPAACGLYLPGAPGLTVQKPLLVVTGDRDAVTPRAVNAEPLFENAFGGPKYFVNIAKGSHGGFIATAPALEAMHPSFIPLDAKICSAVPPGATGPTGAFCQVCLPENLTQTQLPAARHHQLQKASIVAFFDGYLRDERRDQQYLKTGLQNENIELTVIYEGPANQ